MFFIFSSTPVLTVSIDAVYISYWNLCAAELSGGTSSHMPNYFKQNFSLFDSRNYFCCRTPSSIYNASGSASICRRSQQGCKTSLWEHEISSLFLKLACPFRNSINFNMHCFAFSQINESHNPTKLNKELSVCVTTWDMYISSVPLTTWDMHGGSVPFTTWHTHIGPVPLTTWERILALCL